MVEDFYTLTDPNAVLDLSTISDYKTTRTTPWRTTFTELYHGLYNRPEASIKKEGKGFLIGPCQGTRRDANMPYGSVAVLDADASLEASGKVASGAPDFQKVHEALAAWNLSHVLYTTSSHGTGKGQRYRILFPCHTRNKVELMAVLQYVTNALQSIGLPMALTRESHVWSQPWRLPCVMSDSAPYACRAHLGYSLSAKAIGVSMKLLDAAGNPIRTTLPQPVRLENDAEAGDEADPMNLFGQFAFYHSALQILQDNGYTFHGQTMVIDEHGEPHLTYRYRPPGSDSTPGVIAFADPFHKMVDGSQNYCVYSHHTNDPLCNGHANDAYSVFRLLMGSLKTSAYLEAANMICRATGEVLNTMYPSVKDVGAFRVLQKNVSNEGVLSYTSGTWDSFVMTVITWAKVPVVVEDKTSETKAKHIKWTPVPDWWKPCPSRIIHDVIQFKPYPILETHSQTTYGTILKEDGKYPAYFNMFYGWGIEPYPGEWPILREHLLHAVCGGSVDQFEYLQNWIAHLVQHPDEKPGVALVLSGGKGWGKSIVFESLARAVGVHAMTLGNNLQLTGRFNGHLETCLLAVAEESFFSGSHTEEGPLKHLITDRSTTVEKKGVDARTGDSYVRVVLITNENWAAPASSDERRFFIPSMCDYSYQKDIVNGEKGHFFEPLVAETKNGGMAAFLWDMAHRQNISRRLLTNIPETTGLEDQRAFSLRGVDAWLYQVLRDASVRVNEREYTWTSSGISIPERDLLEAVSAAVSSYERERNFVFVVDRKVRKLLQKSVTVSNGTYHFGPLAACREEFLYSTHLGASVFDGGRVPLDGFNGNVSSIYSAVR